MALSTVKVCEAQFREDIAAQLRCLGAGDVTVTPDRVVLELESGSEGPLRIVAGLNEDQVGRPGWADWVQLRIEGEDRTTPLVTLGWFDGGIGSLEKRVDPDMPLDRRGLNAPADIREGRYGRGDVLDRLGAELEAVTGHSVSRALTRVDRPRRAPAIVEPVRDLALDNVVDADFEVVTPDGAGRNVAPGTTRVPSVDELKELLIAEIFAALQQELLSREAAARGTGALWQVKTLVVEALEWAMLGTAYAVDAVTSRTAIGTFLPGDASWLYGLVGPVLIGGLGSLARGKVDRAVAFGLMGGWALFVGLVTASDETYLSGAQAWFPKGEIVRTHERALALARLDQEAAEKEVARLEAKTGTNVTAAFTAAKRRWQAEEIRKVAEAEKRDVGAAFDKAKASLKDAGGRVVGEESTLRQAMLEDPSRREAWVALFAIFTIINFAGPYAISRVLGKWRNDGASAKADAEAGYHAREGTKLLRGSGDAQKTGAMRLFAAAIEKLSRDGIASDVLNQINGAEVAAAAAERFDRSVNPRKYQTRTRFFGLTRS
jgi:hypothetical protein